jgi:hypothetical protein
MDEGCAGAPTDPHVANATGRSLLPRSTAAVVNPRVLRAVLILHVVALVLIRLIPGADDFSDWDLIPFLNANSFPSLWQLLQHPVVHFRQPFTFSTNVGAESVSSAVLLRGLGYVSLYWSPVILLLVYDAVFFALVFWFFRLLFADAFAECVAWALVAMSPVILTFAATSAFNMQGYIPVVLGLVGCEYFIRRRVVVGTLLLTAAFCVMPQGYPLGLFLPYFTTCWVVLRAVLVHPRFGGSGSPAGGVPRAVAPLRVAGCVGVVVGLTALVNFWSGRTYVETISPLAPYGPYRAVPPGEWGKLGDRVVLFVRQSFFPFLKVDGVPVGFAPYFVYATLAVLALLVLLRRVSAGPPAIPRVGWRPWRRVVVAAVVVGSIVFGYVPAFLASAVKSQRAIFGDLFLIALATHGIGSMRQRRLLRSSTIVAVLVLTVCASDAYYLYFTSVDHSKNHSPVFDFDLADGVARHDMVAAIGVMREQVERENAALVVYYPECYTENTTDPNVFFARFLRHFGRYRRPDLIFPCRWCEVKFGCPFPTVEKRRCGRSCCYDDPLYEIGGQQRAGKRVFVWWWREPKELRDQGRWGARGDGLAADSPTRLFRALERRYSLKPVRLPPTARGWECYELVERSDAATGDDV